MDFGQHLREFLGESVDEAEAREIARTVIATTVRSLKLAIGGRLWRAREASRAGDPESSTRHMDAARALKRAYECACREYQAAVQATATDSDRAPGGRTEG